MLVTKQNSILFFLHLIFSCYFCSIDFKRQSEYSGLCSDTSSLVLHFVHLGDFFVTCSECFKTDKIKKMLINSHIEDIDYNAQRLNDISVGARSYYALIPLILCIKTKA